MRAALFALLHGKEFIGLLRAPVAMNVLAFLLVFLGGWLVLVPWYDAVFATPWWLLDGLRHARREVGTNLWLCTTWLLLGPPLFDLVAGGVQEPLRDATERRMLGAPRTPPPDHGVLRLRERARLLLWLLLAWPLCLGLVLLPWVGLPLVILSGAAVAAVVWLEPPMAPRGLDLRQRLHLVRCHPCRSLGLGLALQLAAAVPFVNLLALAPIATIAATATFLQFDKARARGRAH